MPRLRMGIVGCGAIAQIQHLPHLQLRDDLFEIRALCDLSAGLLAALGERYGVPPERRFLDYRRLAESDVDAVIVCPAGSHAPATIAAARAGKHVFVEKPLCYTVREAEEMVAAANASDVVFQVGYMKRYDPGYLYGRERVREMTDVRFVQVNHLHPSNDLHLREFRLRRFGDIPAEATAALRDADARLTREAIGEATPAEARAFHSVLGSMIHDLGNLHGLFGPPTRLVSAEIWRDGGGITTTLEYPGDVRCVATWVDLPELWDFRETLEVYGSRERVLLSFPTGFAVGLPTEVVVQGMESDGTPWKKQVVVSHESAFLRELIHFHECVVNHGRPETPGEDAVADIALVREIILAARGAAG
jgi:predicted dehydrogenase